MSNTNVPLQQLANVICIDMMVKNNNLTIEHTLCAFILLSLLKKLFNWL